MTVLFLFMMIGSARLNLSIEVRRSLHSFSVACLGLYSAGLRSDIFRFSVTHAKGIYPLKKEEAGPAVATDPARIKNHKKASVPAC